MCTRLWCPISFSKLPVIRTFVVTIHSLATRTNVTEPASLLKLLSWPEFVEPRVRDRNAIPLRAGARRDAVFKARPCKKSLISPEDIVYS